MFEILSNIRELLNFSGCNENTEVVVFPNEKLVMFANVVENTSVEVSTAGTRMSLKDFIEYDLISYQNNEGDGGYDELYDSELAFVDNGILQFG